MDASSIIHNLLMYAVPLLFAITVHEAAHAYVAKLMGDRTAEMAGRITLDPRPHIDPVGTLLIPGICLLIPGGFLFGWAKPVPINPALMRFPKKSPFWVSLAGPASNFFMALGWALLAWAGTSGFAGDWAGNSLVELGFAGIKVNLILMIFNLLPLPPLDGAGMLACWIKGKPLEFLEKISPYGFFILLGLGITGLLNVLWLSPWMSAFSWLYAIPGIGR